MIVIHIAAALLSVIVSTLTLALPSRIKLNTSYGLAGVTLVTGFYLILTTPSHMLQACLIGVAYVAVVLPMILVARRRFMYKTTAHKNL
jgi:hypothetical protein